MVIIDAPVIDFVFQPLTDRLGAAGLTPFQIAHFFLDGAALTMVISLLLWAVEVHGQQGLYMSALVTSVSLMLMAIVFVTSVQRWFYRRVETMNRSGMVNVGRLILLPARMIALSLVVIHGFDVRINPSWSHIADFIAYIWWCLSCYFASCSQRPPKYQFANKRTWFGFRPA